MHVLVTVSYSLTVQTGVCGGAAWLEIGFRAESLTRAHQARKSICCSGFDRRLLNVSRDNVRTHTGTGSVRREHISKS